MNKLGKWVNVVEPAIYLWSHNSETAFSSQTISPVLIVAKSSLFAKQTCVV